MLFAETLKEGVFLKRYKRFFADIEFEGQTITAHCPNTGSMKGCQTSNSACRFSISNNPKRKLPYTLEMIKTPDSWVGVNTSLPNKLVFEGWEKKQFPHWSDFNFAQLEIKINPATRLDLVLSSMSSMDPSMDQPPKRINPKDYNFFSKKGPRFHFVEVKNVTLVEDECAYFPDAVTERGQKHLIELMSLMEYGHTGEIFFTVQRNDATKFSPAHHIDPKYAQLLYEAHSKGLKVSAYPCLLSATKIELKNEPLPLQMDF